MQQWQSAIFSAALGFVAGLMGDPIRAYLSNAVHRRQMRIELYRDMIRTYNELVAIVYQVTTYPERLPHLRDSILRYLRGDLLRHFHKTDPASIYRLREFREVENKVSRRKGLRGLRARHSKRV